jgi:hypothetical protein
VLWLINLGFAAGGTVTPPVEVPDVVGQSEASGTAELQGVGFVVAVVTANSSTVAAGDIISQDPIAGSFSVSGSTVTITVSLGDVPTPPAAPVTGGGFFFGYDHYRRLREKRLRDEAEREREAQEIQDETDREIARLLREQEAIDARRAETERLQALADRYAGQAMREGVSRRASAAILKAQEERTRNALEQMQREIERMLEEEEVAIAAVLMLDE